MILKIIAMYIAILIASIAIWVIIDLVASRHRPGKAKKETTKTDPCDTCLRWDECQGVDEACPIRK